MRVDRDLSVFGFDLFAQGGGVNRRFPSHRVPPLALLLKTHDPTPIAGMCLSGIIAGGFAAGYSAATDASTWSPIIDEKRLADLLAVDRPGHPVALLGKVSVAGAEAVLGAVREGDRDVALEDGGKLVEGIGQRKTPLGAFPHSRHQRALVRAVIEPLALLGRAAHDLGAQIVQRTPFPRARPGDRFRA